MDPVDATRAPIEVGSGSETPRSPPLGSTANCSVLVLTKNEAINIRACLASASFSNDLVVFDSFSEDDTVELARVAGARVFQHAFVNYGAQREAARTTVDFRHDWVLALDADERVEPDLANELPAALSTAPPGNVAFRLRRKDYFRGRWIRHATLYPTWHLRVFRPDAIHYPERAVHEYPEVEGSIGALQGHLRHDNFSKGIAEWWRRHLRYAELEAEQIRIAQTSAELDWAALIAPDPVTRRRALKRLSYALPLRPELRYLYMMLLRGAVLDGPAGWEYCRMIAEYQRITDQLVRR